MEEKTFVFGTAASGEYFTDRVKETARLCANFTHGVNTILISPRRWGKTSLVKKVIQTVAAPDLKPVYIDIFSCRSEADFYSRFAEAVVKQTSSRQEEWIDNIKNFLMRFNPRFTVGPDPTAEISFALEFLPKREDAEEILQLPEKIARKKNCRVVVCIDEFQQIGEFPDSLTFQKKLRGVWQHQEQTAYCLFGSKKHLMSELFAKPSHPFYRFGDVLFLDRIPTEDWVDYIRGRFNDTGKEIDADIAARICELVDNQSNYVQQLAWILWVNTDHRATREALDGSFAELLDHNSILFERMTENLTSPQLNFLWALTDGVNAEFTSRAVLERYNLGTSSNVTRIKKALLREDLIDITGKSITIPDAVFRAWLRRIRR